MKTKHLSWLFFSFLSLFIVAMAFQDRSYYKNNKGFSIAEIHPNHLPKTFWDSQKNCITSFDELRSILHGPLTYLGKGHQTVVFESKDKEYVIKFYRFACHRRPWGFTKHPLSFYNKKRKQIQNYDDLKFLKTKQSFALAFSRLCQESGLVAVHLDPSQHDLGKTTLYDFSGNMYTISLDDVVFVVQKKAKLIFSELVARIQNGDLTSAQQIIDELVDYFHYRSLLGIKDEDPAIDKNYGICCNRALQLDIGRLVEDRSMLNEEIRVNEQEKLFSPLHQFLQKQSPELALYLKKKLERT